MEWKLLKHDKLLDWLGVFILVFDMLHSSLIVVLYGLKFECD